MIVQEALAPEKVSEKTSLAKGVYNGSQARDMVKNLIDCQINIYKLENLKSWEACHSEENTHWMKKIDELIQKREELNNVINKAEREGLNINLESTLQIQLSE
ncbi:hypothetical protein SAMN04489761_1195 [Tenacibaculum sp. MAR_2009_124]|uniref:hypothetical protein n=1 Tax=Tenacibaculum sp. MAR_2009_124 TaxID=1250059 RepID=UPI0008958746|nr:hypothetical protein [Tenacibaculum sp. MAR_2009_124]SEB52178.1 hypothetical protein SAMN04489761_1195 [Tenacibaculum sp. MAR_2009_124]